MGKELQSALAGRLKKFPSTLGIHVTGKAFRLLTVAIHVAEFFHARAPKARHSLAQAEASECVAASLGSSKEESEPQRGDTGIFTELKGNTEDRSGYSHTLMCYPQVNGRI